MKLYDELNKNQDLDKLAGRHLAIDERNSREEDSVGIEIVPIPVDPMILSSAKNCYRAVADALFAIDEFCENRNLQSMYFPKQNVVIISRK